MTWDVKKEHVLQTLTQLQKCVKELTDAQHEYALKNASQTSRDTAEYTALKERVVKLEKDAFKDIGALSNAVRDLIVEQTAQKTKILMGSAIITIVFGSLVGLFFKYFVGG